MAVHHELIASSTSTRFPSSMSVSHGPRAPMATTGGIASAPIVLYGCQTCAASIALISAGVNAAIKLEPSSLLTVETAATATSAAKPSSVDYPSTMMTL